MKPKPNWILLAFGVVFFALSMGSRSAPVDPVSPTVGVALFVNDKHDKPINSVTQADLEIWDNKKPPQSIVAVRSGKQLPLRLGLLIDTSNSERRSSLYAPAVQAAEELLYQVLSSSDDKVFVEKFDVIPDTTQFMTKEQLASFKVNLTPGGGTALFDAVQVACEQRMRTDSMRPARRVLIIVSDGGDNSSHVNHDESIAAAQKAGAVVFAVSTEEERPYGSIGGLDTRRLEQFADRTGGRAFVHLNRKDIANVFTGIREQMENMHVVTYVPAEPGPAGQYHSIEMKL